MRRYSLSAALLLAMIAGPLSGCAHTGLNGLANTRIQKMEAQYDLARLAESENQLDKARDLYESILKKDSENAEVYHRLGIVSARQSRFDEAKKFFDEAHRLDPKDSEILNDLGYACYLNGEYKIAEGTLQEALKIDSSNKRATNNLALVLGSEGRLEESYALFRRANKEADAHANVAYLYAQQGQGKKALEHYPRIDAQSGHEEFRERHDRNCPARAEDGSRSGSRKNTVGVSRDSADTGCAASGRRGESPDSAIAERDRRSTRA